MSIRYLGGIITNNATQPTTSSAKGIWTLSQQSQAKYANTWPLGISLDPQFNYVTALLNGDGVNGAQNNTFLDSSTNNFTITRNGNTTQGSFSPYGSNWSNYFSGGNTSTLVNLSSGSVPAIGTGTFTIEFWAFLTNSGNDQQIYDLGTTGFSIYFNYVANQFSVFNRTAATELFTSYSVTSTYNSWNHIALVRNSSNIITLYVNGVASAQVSNTTNFISTSLSLGARFAIFSSSYFGVLGYLSNVRYTNTVVYTVAFTPPTSALTAISGTQLLTCQSNRFRDVSSNALALTVNGSPSVQRFNPFGTASPYSTSVIGGSSYLDGNGDYLSVANNAALQFNADFTVEMWIYPTALSGIKGLFGQRATESNYCPILMEFNGTILQFLVSTTGSSWAVNISSGALTANTWTHVALVRSGSTVTFYINGVAGGTGTASGALMTPVAPAYIGLDSGTPIGAGYFSGYITDFRMVKGTAAYTANFTPPTTPLTAITNTSLLLNMTNAGIYDSAMMNDLETVGNAQVSTSVVKYGNSSMSFNGTNSYLDSTSTSITLGSTWTIECWFYCTSLPSPQVLFDCRPASTNGYYPQVSIASSTQMNFNYNGVDNSITVSNVLNSWKFLAVVKNAGTIKVYLDGVSVFSLADTNTTLIGAARPRIGANGFTAANYFTGYIDDFRITNGVARYTANFTPPTAALPTAGP